MRARVTLKTYLKTDIQSAFFVFGNLAAFPIVLFVLLSSFSTDNTRDLMVLVSFCTIPLLISALALLDTWLMVRSVNKAVEERSWVRGTLVRIKKPGDGTCLLKVLLGQGAMSRRWAFVFADARVRLLTAGSAVDIAEPSIGLLRNPIPLQLLLDSSDLGKLAADGVLAWSQSDVESGLSALPHRGKSWSLLALVALCVVTVVLIAPLIQWVFPTVGDVYFPLVGSFAVLFAFVTWHRHYVEVLPEGVLALSANTGLQVVEWQEILRVVEHAGIGYLDVQTGDAKTEAWIPLFVQDLDGFLEDIIRTAPEENPLYRTAEAILARRRCDRGAKQ